MLHPELTCMGKECAAHSEGCHRGIPPCFCVSLATCFSGSLRPCSGDGAKFGPSLEFSSVVGGGDLLWKRRRKEEDAPLQKKGISLLPVTFLFLFFFLPISLLLPPSGVGPNLLRCSDELWVSVVSCRFAAIAGPGASACVRGPCPVIPGQVDIDTSGRRIDRLIDRMLSSGRMS